MSAPVAVEVTGAKELRRAIKKAQDNDLKVAIKKANLEGAQVVSEEAKNTVPVNTGQLLSTIRAAGTLNAGIVRAGFAKTPYAGVIHFGWPQHNMTPQPFLYEAADNRLDEVVDKYNEAIEAILDDLASSTQGAVI